MERNNLSFAIYTKSSLSPLESAISLPRFSREQRVLNGGDDERKNARGREKRALNTEANLALHFYAFNRPTFAFDSVSENKYLRSVTLEKKLEGDKTSVEILFFHEGINSIHE